MSENVKQKLQEMKEKIISEMKLAPDQIGFGYSRDDLEKMFGQYERRVDADYIDNQPEARSVEGMKRAVWYFPEKVSDYLPDDDMEPSNEYPKGMMPWDYEIEVQPDDSMNTRKYSANLSGEFNVYESDEMSDIQPDNGEPLESDEVDLDKVPNDETLLDLIDTAIASGYDIELVLHDGSRVFLDPMTLQHIKNEKAHAHMLMNVGDTEEFQEFLDVIYSDNSALAKDTHNDPNHPSKVDDDITGREEKEAEEVKNNV